MTLKLTQEIYLKVELEYEVIDPRGACGVLACWLVQGKERVDVWPALDAEDQAALTECCEEDVREREIAEAEERFEVAQSDDGYGDWREK